MRETDPPSIAILAFGPFEVNASTGELLKHGLRVRLPAQPFQILMILIARPGELVTREELSGLVWAKGTFVDFDHGLNAAINKLRRALTDSVEEPRYIETVPGRGYRFIASVEPRAPSPAAPVPAKSDIPASPGSANSAPSNRARMRQWILPGAAALLAIFLAGSFYLQGTSKLTDKDTIILADFKNATGDPVFDETLRQGLSIQLEQSPFLSLISDDKIHVTLGLMSRPSDAALTPELAREVCERTGSAAVLDGSIASLGAQYLLALRAKSCRTGDILDQQQVQAARKEDVMATLSQMAVKLRTKLGESLTTVHEHSTPLAEATTPSLEALKAYTAATKLNFSSGAASAVPLLKRAIEIDPEFATAHALLGRIYGDNGESVLSAESTSSAYKLRSRATDAERFFITATYDQQNTGNLEKAQQTFELWAQTYPRQSAPHTLLSGMIYPVFGKYEKAIEEGKKAIGLDPDVVFGYVTLATAYVFAGRLEEAEATLQRAFGRKFEIPELLVMRYDLAFLRGDKAAMERAVAFSQGKPGAEDSVMDREAFALAYSGRLREARTMSTRAAVMANLTSQRERAAQFETGPVLWEAFSANEFEARRSAMALLDLSRGRDVIFGAALSLALSGDSVQAKTLIDELERRFPEDTSVKFTYLPSLRGLLAVNKGEPQKAIELLQVAAPYELGTPLSVFYGFGALYPIYVRGEAYLSLHRGAEAAMEFQKILDHRSIIQSDPVGARARLELGRAWAMAGDRVKAKAAYQDFLTLWKDADQDVPLLKQAIAEFAKLP